MLRVHVHQEQFMKDALRLFWPSRCEEHPDAEAVKEFLCCSGLCLRLKNEPKDLQLVMAALPLVGDAWQQWLHVSLPTCRYCCRASHETHECVQNAFNGALRCTFIPTPATK